ncbi:MAG: methyltransferase domain-containing protein [Candidatus Lokiarchaeota archaeon]|nr:methyltransferase domain-containing protein [Candidatus Lokiarchaeota archaeon]
MDHRKVGEYWDDNAENWTKLVRLGYDRTRVHLTFPAFLEMLPDVQGLSGLDIGCGEGLNTRAIQKLGANMVAIDISEKFIQYAREWEHKDPLGIEYKVASAVSLPFENDAFDFTIGTMSLMDIPEYDKAIAEAFRVTKPGGFFQFSITHPCFNLGNEWIHDKEGKRKAKVVSGYFEKKQGEIEKWIFGATPKEWKKTMKQFEVPRFDHTLSEWMNACIQAGFNILEEVVEPNPSDELLKMDPSFWTERIVALFIIFRWRKPK